MKYVTLHNVTDICAGKHHGTVRVKANQTRWFVPDEV